MITAKIIADSISDSQIRITTMELKYPLIIHGEFMTHRMFSRNAASNRAIPTNRIMEQVFKEPYIPTQWGKNKSGMQAVEELTGDALREAIYAWERALEDAGFWASKLNDAGLHKQIANRVLMPYQYIKVIVTATEWDNFFKLRLHPDAQPEIQELARCMKEAIDSSTPKLLKPGNWHLPYVLKEEINLFMPEILTKLSVARCARVSYMNHDKSELNIDKDIVLADRLLEAGHMSPFEHQATPMDFAKDTYELNWEEGVTYKDRKDNLWSANFRGWIQYRQLL